MKHNGAKKLTAALLAAIMILSLAACSKTAEKQTGKNGEVNTGPINPMGKYDPPIEITTIRSGIANTLFSEGESIDDNLWYKTYESELGIKLTNSWTVPAGQYSDKFNLSVASNELPDIFTVNYSQFKKLCEDGMLADLSETIEKYTTSLTKEILNQDGGIGLGTAKYKGKYMAMPETNSVSDKVGLLYVRKDWLDKLNLTEPKTLDDVVKTAEAFVKKDPDGNGKEDTIGLALDANAAGFGGSFGNINGFSHAFHAYPNSWIKDSSGKLVYGTIQPEMRNALVKLAQMYGDGLLEKNFTAGKIGQTVAAGKVGMGYGVMWQPNTPLQMSKESDPNANWIALPLPSADGKPALPQIGSAVTSWHVANINCKHPEVVAKLTNLWVELNYGKSADYNKYVTTPDGKEIFKISVNRIWPSTKNLDIHLAVVNALNTKDTSKLTQEQRVTYDKIVAYQNGDIKQWSQYAIFGPGPYSSQAVINNFNKNKNWVVNEFFGATTPTMQDKNADLLQLQTDTVTKIITGVVPISEFDRFVSQWKSLGGDAITKEVNEWYTSK